MAGVGFGVLKSLRNSINNSSHTRLVRSCSSFMRVGLFTEDAFVRPSYAWGNRSYSNESRLCGNLAKANAGVLAFRSLVNAQCSRNNYRGVVLPSSSIQGTGPLFLGLNVRSYSSFFGNKGEKSGEPHVPSASGSSEVDVGNNAAAGGDWAEKLKDLWHNVVDAANYTGQKAKETSDELTPHVHQLLDAHPYLKNVIVPVTGTLTATLLAWVVMPRLLRRFHNYAMQGPTALLFGSLYGDQVPYEKSFWGALEDPIRYLITFMAFSHVATMVAPTAIASQYLAQVWRGAVILSFVWFLHRWKTNVFSRALTAPTLYGIDRDKLLTLDQVSSVGLFVIGIMALAEACGVAVNSILTVGGIGGVATAFAAKDVLGNVLSGLSMQFSRPFSLGDTIKAGSIEGQVVEMGLTSTLLLNAEKFPVIVPNSLFSSQVITNKSRAQWRAMVSRIPIQIDGLDKIPQISNDINNMLRSNSKVFLGKEAPYCYLSRVENSFAELTVGCNLKHMTRNELYSTQQDILLQSVRIIKEHGAKLGSTWQDTTNC